MQIINPIYKEKLSEGAISHLLELLVKAGEDWLTKASIVKLFLRHGVDEDLKPRVIEALRVTRRRVKSHRKVKMNANNLEFNIITLEEFLAQKLTMEVSK